MRLGDHLPALLPITWLCAPLVSGQGSPNGLTNLSGSPWGPGPSLLPSAHFSFVPLSPASAKDLVIRGPFGQIWIGRLSLVRFSCLFVSKKMPYGVVMPRVSTGS